MRVSNGEVAKLVFGFDYNNCEKIGDCIMVTLESGEAMMFTQSWFYAEYDNTQFKRVAALMHEATIDDQTRAKFSDEYERFVYTF